MSTAFHPQTKSPSSGLARSGIAAGLAEKGPTSELRGRVVAPDRVIYISNSDSLLAS
jgi:hypothetical protein